MLIKKPQPVARRAPSENLHILLYLEVSGVCPLCSKALMYKKKGKNFKDYDVAHIYPLNPTLEELAILKDVKKLSDDLNDEKNLIPLCLGCHGQFDKPRTVEEYEQLAALKKKFSNEIRMRGFWETSKIEGDVLKIISSLSGYTVSSEVELSYDPQTIENKTDTSIRPVTKRTIQHNVRDYFLYIQQSLAILDKESSEASQLISVQMKQHYLVLKSNGQSQQEIFENMTDWLNAKTSHVSKHACEAFVSFFIQNCEVFSDNTK